MLRFVKKMFVFDLVPSLTTSIQQKIPKEIQDKLVETQHNFQCDLSIISDTNDDLMKRNVKHLFPLLKYIFPSNGSKCIDFTNQLVYQKLLFEREDYPTYLSFLEEINTFLKSKNPNYNSFQDVSIRDSMIHVHVKDEVIKNELCDFLDFRKRMYPFRHPVSILEFPQSVTVQPSCWNKGQIVSFLHFKNYQHIYYFGSSFTNKKMQNSLFDHPYVHSYKTHSLDDTMKVLNQLSQFKNQV